ncbi:MAG: hypothetical protein OFPI_25300 [Osedax symbiont Rs2]|nr:MAG: hypothetical protein OFPI_25300 [Osedax symbiont Rs2]
MKTTREVKTIVSGIATTDGDGMPLTRMIGSAYLEILDPFVLLDVFDCDKAEEYIGGFPAHPHKGFESVTYMLNGKMRHCDSKGSTSLINAGGVQWMSTGKGVIDSKMPMQTSGLLKGLMLWVNLPADEKMSEPNYQLAQDANIPAEQRENQCRIKVIAGCTSAGTAGFITNKRLKPIYWDIQLSVNGAFTENIPCQHTAFIYVISGQIEVGEKHTELCAGQLAVLNTGEIIKLSSSNNTRLVLIAAQALNEPVVRAGPFVMNSRKQVDQAIDDYQKGVFI